MKQGYGGLIMKGKLNVLLAGVAMITMTACSSTKTYVESTSYKVPKWYDDCQQYTTDEWYKLFWREKNLVGCGAALMGLKTFQEAQQL